MLWSDDHKRLEAKIDHLGCRIDCLTNAVFSLLVQEKDYAKLAEAEAALKKQTDALQTAHDSVISKLPSKD